MDRPAPRLGGARPDAHTHGTQFRRWLALADRGDALPLGSGLFMDESGHFRRANVREFAFDPPGEKLEDDFEQLVVAELAAAYDSIE